VNVNLRRIFVILTLAACGMAALLSLLPATGHDQLWFLLMSRRWLAGADLYGPVAFDSNPPAIVWLGSLPVLLGSLLHVEATSAAKWLATLAETAVSLLGYRLLTHADTPELDLPTTPQSYKPIALLFAAVVIFYIVPARDFGQREHLLSFLVLPYVLAAALPRRSFIGLRVLAGLLAGIALCLKPQQALIPVFVEAALLLAPSMVSKVSGLKPDRRSLLRPEPILILLIGGVYVLAIHTFAPLYFTTALPVLRDTYWAIGGLNLLHLAWEAVELFIVAVIAFTISAKYRPSSPAIRLLLIAGGASTVAYLIQGTGWYYQQLPAITFFASALVLELLDLASRKNLHIPSWTVGATVALSVLALVLTTHFTNYPFTADRSFAIDTPDPAFFRDLPPGTSIATLSTSVDANMMPVERYHLVWAQRMTALWMLPAILRSETAPQTRLTPLHLARLEAIQHRWMLEDFARWHPQLILVHRCEDPAVTCQHLEGRHDNLLAWFLRDPAFAALWSHYRYDRSLGPFDAYIFTP
jgi:hypothetical protein